jgi:hypothetical protein
MFDLTDSRILVFRLRNPGLNLKFRLLENNGISDGQENVMVIRVRHFLEFPLEVR